MSLIQPLQPKDRLCFLHIVKTAGSSFSHHLKNQFSAADISPARYWPELLAMPESERNRYKLISGHFAYDIAKYLDRQPTKYVTMLRDPIARTISVYTYIKEYIQTVGSAYDHGEMTAYMEKFSFLMNGGIEAFIKADDKDVRLAISNTQTLILAAGDPEALPESITADLLENAKSNLKELAYFGLTERMQESLELLSYTFGWRPFQNLELNITSDKSRFSNPPADLAALVDMIKDMNRLDIELHKFADELFAGRYAQMLEDLNRRFPVEPSSSGGAEAKSLLLDQLERHYEQCYRENTAIVSSHSFNKTLGSLPVGEGWWQWEAHGDSGYRWTGPGTISTLDLPLLTDRPLIVTFKIIGSITPDVIESLHLRVNQTLVDSKVGVRLIGMQMVYVVWALLSVDVLKSDKPFARIDLVVSRTVSAKKISPALRFDRNVGIAIHSIDVRPADGIINRVQLTLMVPIRQLLMALRPLGRWLKRKIRNMSR